MLLVLADPAWGKLPASNGHSRDIVAWLKKAKVDGQISDEQLGELVDKAADQGDASLAVYGVVPYLVEFALSASSQKETVRLLTQAGLLFAALSRAALDDPDDDVVVTGYESAKAFSTESLHLPVFWGSGKSQGSLKH